MSVNSLPAPRTSLSEPLRLVGLHLLPGVLMLVAMLLVGSLAERVGLPPHLVGVGAGGILLGTAFQLGYLFYLGRKRNGRLSLQGILLYRERMPAWQYLALILPILAWLAFIWYILRPPVNRFFIDNFFAWMPGFFFDEYLVQHLHDYSRATLLAAAVAFTFAISLGGAIEELYFRGYLLPRLAFLGKWAPAVNVLLFSLYHFWSPWENIARLLALLPFVYAVWWKRNVYLAVLVHFTINLFSGLSLLAMIIKTT